MEQTKINQTNKILKIEGIKKESLVKNLVSGTFYTVISFICLDLVFAISIHFLSKNNNEDVVSGFGLAFTLDNLLIIPISFGMNQSLNLHSSQSLGQKKFDLSQSYLTITLLIHTICFIPFSIIILSLKQAFALLININSRQIISDNAQLYLYFLLPSSYFYIIYEAIKSYLISYQIFSIFMYLQLLTATLHILWCYIFIKELQLGLAGAGISIILTESLNLIFLIIIIISTKYKKIAFFNYSIMRFTFSVFRAFLKSTFPLIVHIYADFFIFFLMNLLSVTFGSNQLNAQIALSNTSSFCFKFPLSLSFALITYVGKEMGMGNIRRAKQYTMIGVGIFILNTAFLILMLIIFKEQWYKIQTLIVIIRADFYSSNDEIKNILLQTYPVFVFGQIIFDALQGTLTGVLKGIEKKNFVTYSTLGAYYLIGIPLIVFFSEKWGVGLQVQGSWLGCAISNFSLSILYMTMIIVINWQKQSDQIYQRINNEQSLTSNIKFIEEFSTELNEPKNNEN